MVIDDTMCLISLNSKTVGTSGGIQRKKLVKSNTKLALFGIKLYPFQQNTVQKKNVQMVCSSSPQSVVCKICCKLVEVVFVFLY